MAETAAWTRVRAAFERAVELAGSERATFLRTLAPEVQHEVAALLDADTRTPAWLDGDALDLEQALLEDEPIATPPPGLTPVEVLGRGGSATVWRARPHRHGPDVALKVLRHVAAAPLFLQRFEHERATLAGLDHPGVIRLLGAGELADGRPYLVTECVEGVPIDRWCRSAAPRDVLALFVQVCRAVHHAHRHMVVHRDLKPSNVLVTADGEPKVLDFGIAKILDPVRDPAWTDLYGRGPLTPAFASPEQLAGRMVGTASDVYSLGVLLFHLVTGGSPYRGGNGATLERAVREEPPRAAREVAAEHGRPRPSPDLETVLDAALHKDPERRTPSAEHLAEDLERLLAGRPPRARREPWPRRASRWIRRHPLAAGLVALLLALGAGSWIGTLRSLERVRASESVAWRAHASAVRSTAALAELLQRIAAHGELSAGDLRGLLSEFRAQVDALEDTPEAQARLALALAAAEAALGEPAAARQHAELALERARSTRGLTWRDQVASLDLLIELARAEGSGELASLTEERESLLARSASSD